ncbi:MAG: CRTAC1 family protein, partial [Euryarchaeota archaeon]|nr:CRTAC1 family protein [Euryarchaeota archaeon]
VLALLLTSVFSALGEASQSTGDDPEGVAFADIANSTGLDNISTGHISTWASYGPGTSWGDYDGDGDLDLYVTARFDHLGMEIEDHFGEDSAQSEIDAAILENSSGETFLMRNDGGIFTDVSDLAGVKLLKSTAIGASWADYDGDGDVDLYISNYGFANFTGELTGDRGEPNILYNNNGDGTFTDVTVESLTGNPGHSTGGIWADYDHDGDLDLYSLNAGIVDEEDFQMWMETNILYRNDGDSNGDGIPEFSDQTVEAGKVSGQNLNSIEDYIPAISDETSASDMGGGPAPSSSEFELSPAGSGVSWAGLWFDYNNDGWEDLFVASDFGISPMYRNNGDGTFKLVTTELDMVLKGTGMGAHAADIDGDGDFDLCQTNFGPNYIWYNEDGEKFSRVLDADIHNDDDKRETVNWDCHFFDYDLDGDFDLFMTAGRINTYVSMQENTLFRNDGNGQFTDVTDETGLSGHLKSMGGSTIDFDGDGDIDIVVGNADAPIQLFENNAAQVTGNHWLKVKLQGNHSNTHGIGCLVEVEFSNGKTISQQVYAGSGYLGSGDSQVHFGLGSQSTVSEVRVHWSTGHVQIIDNVTQDSILLVMEEAPPAEETSIIMPIVIGIIVLGCAGLFYSFTRKKISSESN